MIDVNNESGTEVDELGLLQLAEFALAQLRIHPQAELSILLVDEAAMAELHQRFMDQPGPTDVMSFPMDELRPGLVNEEPEEGVLGDLVLCPAIAERQATEARDKGQAGYTTADEVDLLTVHGILHLLGYDHAEPAEKKVMFDLNDRLVAAWDASRS